LVARLNMKESEKSKQRTELEKLKALEKSIRTQDQAEIQKLLKEIGESKVSLKAYLELTNTKLSFDLSIENSEEE